MKRSAEMDLGAEVTNACRPVSGRPVGVVEMNGGFGSLYHVRVFDIEYRWRGGQQNRYSYLMTRSTAVDKVLAFDVVPLLSRTCAHTCRIFIVDVHTQTAASSP